MLPKHYSQVGQDLFALYMMRHKPLPKTYLDIGCHVPIGCNNSYLLEEHGWQGLSVDIDNLEHLYRTQRKNPFYCTDVTKVDWDTVFPNYPFLKDRIDYLSFDIDEATHQGFLNFPFDKIRFNVITMEHDSYRFGDGLKNMLRTKLNELGYTLVCGDVIVDGYGAFEDWWVDLTQVDTTVVDKVKCMGKHHMDICNNLVVS